MSLGKKKMQMQGASGVDNTANFMPVTYTGNGGSTNFVTVGFTPDFTWVGRRDTASGFPIVDRLRGNGRFLDTSATSADDYNSAHLSLETNGFDANSNPNVNNATYISWNFKAGGAGVSGSSSQATNVTMSPNTEAGFSIVNFTSSASTAQPPPMNYISHGLNAAPEMVFYKRRDSAQNWVVQHKDLNQSTALALNLTNAVGSPATYTFFDNNSTNIGVRSNYAISRNANYIAYCFHSVTGRTKVGTYEGDGQDDRQVTGLGFRPRFVLGKNADSTGNWWIIDSARGDDKTLLPNNSATAEIVSSTSWGFHLLNDGFEITNGGNTSQNANGDTFIYLAIA